MFNKKLREDLLFILECLEKMADHDIDLLQRIIELEKLIIKKKKK